MTVLSPVLCLLAAPAAVAQAGAVAPEAAAAPETAAREWYLDLGLGINWLDQESGHPQPADPGYRLSLACGHQYNERWGLELETGYVRNALPAVEDREKDTMGQVPVLLNLIHTFPTRTSLRPFIGAGGGVVIGSSSDDTGGDAALQFMIGVRHLLEGQKSIGLSYRFIMLGASSAFAAEPVGNDALLLDLKLPI